MRHIPAAALAIAGLVHLLPLSGVLGADRLLALYGVVAADADSLLLLRHRAVLLGLLGGWMLWAAFRPAMQRAALVVGLASVGAFVALAWLSDGMHPLIARVVAVDLAVAPCLLAGLLASWRDGRRDGAAMACAGLA